MPHFTSNPWHLQEKQIRGKHAVKQLRDRMKANQLQVADRVRKHVASARLLPKVVSASCRQSCALRSSRHLEGYTACSGGCTAAACSWVSAHWLQHCMKTQGSLQCAYAGPG